MHGDAVNCVEDGAGGKKGKAGGEGNIEEVGPILSIGPVRICCMELHCFSLSDGMYHLQGWASYF